MPSRKNTWDLIGMAYRKNGTLTDAYLNYKYNICENNYLLDTTATFQINVLYLEGMYICC